MVRSCSAQRKRKTNRISSGAKLKVFGNLESFKAFQAAQQEGFWEVPPTVTNLTLVDSSPDLFS